MKNKKLIFTFIFFLTILGFAFAINAFNPQSGTAKSSSSSLDQSLYYYTLLTSIGLAALAAYYKKTFIDHSTPSFDEWKAALADYAMLRYGKNYDELTSEERVNLKKEFLELFGGYTYFTEDEIDYMKNVSVISPFPSTQELLKSTVIGSAFGAAVGAVIGGILGAIGGASVGGIGAAPGAIAGAIEGAREGAIGGAIAGAIFDIAYHFFGWGFMQVRKYSLERKGDPVLVVESLDGSEHVINKDQNIYVPPEDFIIGSRDRDTIENNGIAKLSASVVAFLFSIVGSVFGNILRKGTSSATGLSSSISDDTMRAANSMDDAVGSSASSVVDVTKAGSAVDDAASVDDASRIFNVMTRDHSATTDDIIKAGTGSADEVANSVDDVANTMDDVVKSGDDITNTADDVTRTGASSVDDIASRLGSEYGDDIANFVRQNPELAKDVESLLARYGDDAAEIIRKYGKRGVEILTKYDGKDIIKFYKAEPIVEDGKLEYAFNPEKGKSKGFEILGYSKTCVNELREELIKQSSKIDKIAKVSESSYGTRYKIQDIVVGPNGKIGKLTTVWQVEGNRKRLITLIMQPYKVK